MPSIRLRLDFGVSEKDSSEHPRGHNDTGWVNKEYKVYVRNAD